MTPEWANGIKMNVPAFQEYAKGVYAASDTYLANLPDDDLDRKIPSPLGDQTIGWLITMVLATHPITHSGEVGALKGVHGMKGWPF